MLGTRQKRSGHVLNDLSTTDVWSAGFADFIDSTNSRLVSSRVDSTDAEPEPP